MAAPPVVFVTRRGAQRWRSGHPWIFRDDVRPGSPASDGDVVLVVEEPPPSAAGSAPRPPRPIGQAFWAASSRIALRMITRSLEPLGVADWSRRIRDAVAWRERIVPAGDACRLVSADADGIPGLIIDRYGEHLVLQALVPGVDRLQAQFARLAAEAVSATSVLARNDPAVRLLEGLPRTVEPLFGETPETVEAREAGIVYLADLRAGQKTGAFLDQRENRAAAAQLCSGRVADLFCYHGSFALHAARRGASVVAVDSSAAALERGRRNAELNGLGAIEFVEDNVFDFLRNRERSGERFRAIFLDPPAFAKSRTDVPAAGRAYKEINLRALKLLEPGGFLFTSSCSYNLSEEAFLEILREAAADAGRAPRIVERRGAGPDHPPLLGLPESRYLKCVFLRA